MRSGLCLCDNFLIYVFLFSFFFIFPFAGTVNVLLPSTHKVDIELSPLPLPKSC